MLSIDGSVSVLVEEGSAADSATTGSLFSINVAGASTCFSTNFSSTGTCLLSISTLSELAYSLFLSSTTSATIAVSGTI